MERHTQAATVVGAIGVHAEVQRSELGITGRLTRQNQVTASNPAARCLPHGHELAHIATAARIAGP